MDTTAIAKRATELGKEHRAAFTYEFGEEPDRETIGDWDAEGWGKAWDIILTEIAPDEPGEGDYATARAAYDAALFADE